MVAAGFLLAYVGLEWLSFMHEHRGLPITPWNPGLGLAFALIIWGGWPFAGLLFIGVILAEILVLQTSLGWTTVASIGAIYSLVYGWLGVVAQGRFGLHVGVERLGDIAILLGSALAGAIVVALVLTLLLQVDAQFLWQDVTTSALPLLIGDVIGIAAITPLILRMLHFSGRLPLPSSRLMRAELALCALLAAAAMWLVGHTSDTEGFRFFYLLFVPVVIAAVRHGLDGACIALAFTQFCLAIVLHLFSTDAAVFTEFQTLMLVLTSTGLVVGAVVSERRLADRRRREAEARLRTLIAESTREARFHLVNGMASALAHEINQPLTAARALVRSAEHLVGQEQADLTRAGANLGKALAQIDHAGGVIRHIRAFLSRKEQSFSTLDPGETIREGLLLVEADAAARGLSLRVDTPKSLPHILGDRVQIQQVLLNLVRNAIEAHGDMGAPGTVSVAILHEPGSRMLHVAVHDTGPGLDPERAARVFEPLSTSKHEGFGLGLAICASIMEAHGGQVWLDHSRPGSTEFRFSLPVANGG
jgi:two-component system, LuxR family, sensor kinase FixL